MGDAHGSRGPGEEAAVKVADGEKSSSVPEKDHDDGNEVVVMDEDTVIY